MTKNASADNSFYQDSDPTGRYLFYVHRGLGVPVLDVSLPPGYTSIAWQPSIRTLWPPGTAYQRTRLRFLFRCVLHLMGLFSGPDCGAICVLYDGHLVHYSGFTPRYWRFGFMGAEDLQIGDTWTDPKHRRHGLALFALSQVLRQQRRVGRNFWYCVGAPNRPSIRVVERAGFEVAAEGEWRKPFGIKLLGSYVPTRGLHPAPSRRLLGYR